jgi:secretion/DNA translocation related TadE-like protein
VVIPAANTQSSADAGSGSILGITLVAATASAVLLLAPVCVIQIAQVAVSTAADAAALAAADARIGLSAGFPCAVAERVAAANGTTIAGCRLDGFDATVRVHSSVLGFEVEATATAGPPRERAD